jgi:hypothetical protein
MQAIPAAFATIFGGTAAASTAAAATATATTLSSITTGLQVVGTVAGMASAMSQASYNSKVAENNAIIADQNAQEAILDSQKEAQQRGLAAQAEMGDLLANQAASGLNLGSGSYALARKSQAELAARDTEIVTADGRRRAENYQQQATDFRSEAAQQKAAGRWSIIEGGLGIASSAVSGATRVNKIKAKRYA